MSNIYQAEFTTGCNDDLWIKLANIHRFFTDICKNFNKQWEMPDNTRLQGADAIKKLSTVMWIREKKFIKTGKILANRVLIIATGGPEECI